MTPIPKSAVPVILALALSGAGAGCHSAPTVFDAAPTEIAAHPDPQALLDDADPQLAENKRLAFDMWRSIVNAGHVELADDMLQEGYVQHSPVLPTGRDAFKMIFSAVPHREIPETVSPPLVALLAEGDLVVMALREELLAEGDEPYTTTHFNLFRVEHGRLAEHWHSLTNAPGPDVARPEDGGPQPVTGATGADQQDLLSADDPQLAANKRLVFDALLGLFSDGAEGDPADFLSADYTEYDPRGFAGRELFPASPDGPLAAPLVSMVAADDLVVAVTGREHPHPIRSKQTYTTTRFDMFRVTDGRIAAHWSGALRDDHVGGAWGDPE